MRFWTACHEIGHTFNLAHSWQKALPKSWIPLANEPLARSFMNYPYNVPGGQASFFADFEFRFTNSELLFMRHAPDRFVEMGNALWFDNHGFQQAALAADPNLQLQVRCNRAQASFEFLEPVVLELKFTNTSNEPQIINANVLAATQNLIIIINKQGRDARQFVPYAEFCYQPEARVLNPGDSIYESLYISSGRNGFDISEPGNYTVQAALQVATGTVVSAPLALRVTPPKGYEEETLAQDVYTHNVGRVMAFDGSRCLTSANDTLTEVTERLANRKIAVHAGVALGTPLAGTFKEYQVTSDGANATRTIQVRKAHTAEATQQLRKALVDPKTAAAETLGHIDFKYYVDRFTDFLNKQGEAQDAVKIQEGLLSILKSRNVLNRVLETVRQRIDEYQGKEPVEAGARPVTGGIQAMVDRTVAVPAASEHTSRPKKK